MANENQNTGANPGLNLNQQLSDLQNLRQGLKDLLDDQGDYNNLLKNSLKDLEKTTIQYKKIEDRLSALSKESINVKEVNQELYKLRQKESDEQKKLTQLQSLYGKQTVSGLENAKKRALEDKKLYESQGTSFDLQKEILNNLQEQGNLEAVKIFTQQKQLEFAKQKTREAELALENEKNLSKQLGITGNSAEVLAKKLSVGKEAYAIMVAEARKLLEEQKTLSQLPQQKLLDNPQQSQAPAQVQQVQSQPQIQQAQVQQAQIQPQVQQAQTQQAQAQSQAQQTISQAQAQAQTQQAQAQSQAQQTISQALVQALQTIGQALAQGQQIISQAQAQAQPQAQQPTGQATIQPQQAPLNNPIQPQQAVSTIEQIDVGKSLEQSIRDSRRLQGDTNSELNKSINLISQINDLRDQSISKVKALNKETINTRDIQKEFQKAKEKEALSLAKVTKLESSLGDVEKQNARTYLEDIEKRERLEQDIQRARLRGNTALVVALGNDLALVDQRIEDAQLGLNIDERRYAAAIQANKVASETKNLLKGELDIEKEIQKSVGLTGVALGKVSEKLGLGSKYSAELVEKARELEDEGKKLTFGDKLSALKKAGVGAIRETFTDPLTAIPAAAAIAVGAYKAVEAGLTMIGNAAAKTGNFVAGLSEDSSNIVRGLASNVSGLARNIPLVGGLLGGLIDGFAAILDLVLGVDNMIVKTGRQLNMSAEAARGLYRQFGAISQASGDIYMNGKKYLESQLELTKELGTTNVLSKEILRTNIQLKDFAGLEADTRAKIAESAQITGERADDTVKSVLSQVSGLQKATGVSFQYQRVLKEVSNLGGYLGLQFAKYPKELTKSFLAAKTLGLELKQLDGMANSFLDFESSISKEFEAQLLTGKDINLNKAREAFLNNDLAGAAAEIAKYTGDAAGYSKMNRIQQDSLADAMGMSRDQMADMLKQQELYSKFGVKNREDLLKQVDLLRKAGKEQEAINKAGGEAAYNDLVRSAAQEKLALFIEKIKQSIVEFIESTNLIDKVEKFINMLSDPSTIQGILGKIKSIIASFIEIAGELIADVVEGVGWIKNFFTTGRSGDIAEQKAKERASSIREGSASMAAGLRDFGVEYKGVSVGENVANSQVKRTEQNQNAMAMIGTAGGNAPSPTFYFVNKNEISDTAKAMEDRLIKAVPMDTQTG